MCLGVRLCHRRQGQFQGLVLCHQGLDLFLQVGGQRGDLQPGGMAEVHGPLQKVVEEGGESLESEAEDVEPEVEVFHLDDELVVLF